MKTFLTADWHLGEDRFQLMGRAFSSVEEHNETLIERHNKIVGPDDQVIVVGDAVYQKAPKYLSLVSRFNGHKTLIRGNHDRIFGDKDLYPYFERVISEGDGLDLQIGGIDCYATHYPTLAKVRKFNLIGHIHGAWKYQLNMFNVGVDTNCFYPVDLEAIPFHFTAIRDFYDDDVWAAYLDQNLNYRQLRGKPGSYFHG